MLLLQTVSLIHLLIQGLCFYIKCLDGDLPSKKALNSLLTYIIWLIFVASEYNLWWFFTKSMYYVYLSLQKGGGYHLDLLIVALCIGLCSVFGLPWFVAATVLSINHVRSLTRESESSAPGEKPQFLGIRYTYLYIAM